MALEAYAAWHRIRETIHTALSTRMLKRGVARNVRIELPDWITPGGSGIPLEPRVLYTNL